MIFSMIPGQCTANVKSWWKAVHICGESKKNKFETALVGRWKFKYSFRMLAWRRH